MEVIHTSPEPILNNGEFSCFDEDGVVPSSIINIRGKKYLYYFGWQKHSLMVIYYCVVLQ